MGIPSCDDESACVCAQRGSTRSRNHRVASRLRDWGVCGWLEWHRHQVLRRCDPVHLMKQLHTKLFMSASKVRDAGPMTPKMAKPHAQAAVSPEIRTIPGVMKDNSYKCAHGEGHSGSMRHLLQENARALIHRIPTMPNLSKLLSDNKLNHASRSAPSTRRVHQDFQSVRRPSTTESQNQKRPIYIIMPRSSWKIRWDLWIGFVIAYSVILVPYRIGFAIDLGVRFLACALLCCFVLSDICSMSLVLRAAGKLRIRRKLCH